ncbi:hypothetical protein ABFS82_14G015800 [Erythranthe guttata]|uniref:Uncharacterized protein n=1 Tax=Erythranthe guttata TaxID=4155 RepID=A0A022S2X4_ERYGU|nr:PREDICTED: uncharacterized protein LOC105962559 [Erythranthe guttata]EYU45635.1 hypothetical protein MIMGU_mgv1a011977mg [Erythranthe guttata]|eukprot:XP_012842332.1 PREDICTED: uncharacterized protein LOC105962559 [Erythranthe guttata]
MVSQEALESTCGGAATAEPTISGPRISFSTEFLDENDFISICPNRHPPEKKPENRTTAARNGPEFEFLSGNSASNMTTADELFSEGKMLPFWQTHHQYSETTLNKLKTDTTTNIAAGQAAATAGAAAEQDRRISWFLDDDPSPRPPKCTVLWKELLRLRKQRPSTLSPSSSSSSSSSGRSAIADNIPTAADEQRKIKGVAANINNNNKVASSSSRSTVKKGLERTRSGSNSIRIRPVVNVPICTQVKSSSLPPLFPIRSRTKLLS